MNARILIGLTLVGAVLPHPLLAATIASGSATSEYTLTFSNFDPANEFGYPYCLGGALTNQQRGPQTTGRGVASGSADIPDPTCTVLSDGWVVTIPRRSIEGSAGLEFPLEFPDHLDQGSFVTQLFAEFDAESFTVDSARTVFVTVEGLLSANGQTEALEALHGPHQAASTGSTMSSRAILWVFSDEDPAFANDFIELWNFDNRCVDIVTHGSTADCSFDAQQSLEQSLAFDLRPDYRYWFRLMISETFAVRAGSFSVPEPGTLALLTLGLLGIAVRRRRRTDRSAACHGS